MNTRVRHGRSQAFNPSIAVAGLRRELGTPAAIVVFDCALCAASSPSALPSGARSEI